MAMANDEARKATTNLFNGCWHKSTPKAAILKSLSLLANGYEKPLTDGMVTLYTAALWELSQEQIVLGFARATEECKFFPSPATLREFSGRAVTGDPLAAEAKAELLKLIEGMRSEHGPTLKPILGPVLYGTYDDPKDAEGNRVGVPIRGESTPFRIARRTEAALVRLGWGDRMAGIALIAEHPIVAGGATEDGQYQTNRLHAADELLAKWTSAYREVR